ncbi:MAG: PH domain-containing protein [Propionibacteriaceae bacterium]
MITDDAFSPEDLDWQHIDPAWINLKRIHMAIGWGAWGLLAAAPFFVIFFSRASTEQWLLWAGAGVLLATLVVIIARMSRAPRLWRAWGYAERGEDLYLRYGIWWRSLIVVPYGRMQMVDVSSGPIEQAFGLASVKLVTAAESTGAKIQGLTQADAQRLREHLIERGNAGTAGL